MTARFWNTNPRRSAASKRPSGIANILLPRHTTLIDAKIGFWSFSAVCLLLVSTVLLTGCTAIFQQVNNKSNSESNGIEAGTMTLGEKLEAGTGTFDRNDPSFQLFDPCVEISAEQYAELGYEVNEASYVEARDAFMINCSFFPTEGNTSSGVLSIASDGLPYSHLEEIGVVLTDMNIEAPDGAYFHEFPNDEGQGLCIAAISTNSGRLSVTYKEGIGEKLTRQQSCKSASDLLTKILNLEI